MNQHIHQTKGALGNAAARQAAQRIHEAIQSKGQANIILATGASQFEMLDALVAEAVDWSRVVCFHLDEYVGLPETHPASFRNYLKERFVRRVNGLRMFHFVNGTATDPWSECRRLGRIIAEHPIDVCCAGIGENAHLAFNDPPADFDAEDPYRVVTLDEACRRQQLGEGWFPTLADVPSQAISMGIRQILKSRCIILSVPDLRKARAVRDSLEGPVTPQVPSSILQHHPDCHIHLDKDSASLLREG